MVERFTLYREAKIEFGEAIASRLKLSPDGTRVLWPQPSDDPEDPQNVRFQDILLFLILLLIKGRMSFSL